jgi:hypothetical protein
MLAKPSGYNVNKLIEALGKVAKQGYGELPVMLDISVPGGPPRMAKAGMGLIGIASDLSKVLVIMQADEPIPTINLDLGAKKQ